MRIIKQIYYHYVLCSTYETMKYIITTQSLEYNNFQDHYSPPPSTSIRNTTYDIKLCKCFISYKSRYRLSIELPPSHQNSHHHHIIIIKLKLSYKLVSVYLSILWQRIIQFHRVLKALSQVRYERLVLDQYG